MAISCLVHNVTGVRTLPAVRVLTAVVVTPASLGTGGQLVTVRATLDVKELCVI